MSPVPAHQGQRGRDQRPEEGSQEERPGLSGHRPGPGGEAISWHLKELLDIPDDKTYRVTFNEITKKVVNDSIAAPRAIDQNLVDAQQARRILDRIVGYELSPAVAEDPAGPVRRAGPVGGYPAGGGAGGGDPGLCPQEYWTIEAELERVRPNLGGFKAQFYGREKKMELRSREGGGGRWSGRCPPPPSP